MKFKYQTEIRELGLDECPPAEYGTSNFSAFRFVSHTHHPNNFKPVGIIYPKRLNDFKEDTQKCQALGLSMFADKENAQRRFHHLQLKTAGKFVQLVGSRLAELNLEAGDGVHSNLFERQDSHFTFHEFEGIDLMIRILNIEYL